MANGEDWLMRPVLHGLCRYESVAAVGLTLADFADMNEALDVYHLNRRRHAPKGS